MFPSADSKLMEKFTRYLWRALGTGEKRKVEKLISAGFVFHGLEDDIKRKPFIQLLFKFQRKGYSKMATTPGAQLHGDQDVTFALRIAGPCGWFTIFVALHKADNRYIMTRAGLEELCPWECIVAGYLHDLIISIEEKRYFGLANAVSEAFLYHGQFSKVRCEELLQIFNNIPAGVTIKPTILQVEKMDGHPERIEFEVFVLGFAYVPFTSLLQIQKNDGTWQLQFGMHLTTPEDLLYHFWNISLTDIYP